MTKLNSLFHKLLNKLIGNGTSKTLNDKPHTLRCVEEVKPSHYIHDLTCQYDHRPELLEEESYSSK